MLGLIAFLLIPNVYEWKIIQNPCHIRFKSCERSKLPWISWSASRSLVHVLPSTPQTSPTCFCSSHHRHLRVGDCMMLGRLVERQNFKRMKCICGWYTRSIDEGKLWNSHGKFQSYSSNFDGEYLVPSIWLRGSIKWLVTYVMCLIQWPVASCGLLVC